jgi:hypothetical protein
VTGTLIILVVLTLFTRFDQLLDRVGRETRTYEVIYPAREEKHDELERLFHECGLQVRTRKRLKRNGSMVSVWDLEGRVRSHVCLSEKLMADKEIVELRY